MSRLHRAGLLPLLTGCHATSLLMPPPLSRHSVYYYVLMRSLTVTYIATLRRHLHIVYATLSSLREYAIIGASVVAAYAPHTLSLRYAEILRQKIAGSFYSPLIRCFDDGFE